MNMWLSFFYLFFFSGYDFLSNYQDQSWRQDECFCRSAWYFWLRKLQSQQVGTGELCHPLTSQLWAALYQLHQRETASLLQPLLLCPGAGLCVDTFFLPLIFDVSCVYVFLAHCLTSCSRNTSVRVLFANTSSGWTTNPVSTWLTSPSCAYSATSTRLARSRPALTR